MQHADADRELDWFVFSNDDPKRRVAVPPGRSCLRIGSGEMTDIRIEHPSVAENHATLHWQRDRQGWEFQGGDQMTRIELASPGPSEFRVGDVSLMLVGEPRKRDALTRFGFSKRLSL